MLVKLSANLNLQDNELDTALHDSITLKNDHIVDLLVEANAFVFLSNKLGFNVIQHAVLMDNARLVDSSKKFIDEMCNIFNALHYIP